MKRCVHWSVYMASIYKTSYVLAHTYTHTHTHTHTHADTHTQTHTRRHTHTQIANLDYARRLTTRDPSGKLDLWPKAEKDAES